MFRSDRIADTSRVGTYDRVDVESDRLRELNARLAREVAALEARLEEREAAGARPQEADLVAAASVTLLDTLDASGPIGFGLIDRDFRYVRVNQALAAINGIPAEDHENRLISDLLPNVWPQVEPVLRHVLETGLPVTDLRIDGESPATGGEIGNWMNTLYPVSAFGCVVGIGCLVVDVTDRHRAERFREAVMETMVEGLIAVDRHGRLSFMNAAATRLLGWTEDQLRGQPIHERVHPGCTSESCVLTVTRRDGQTVAAVEDSFARADGTTLPVIYSSAPLPSARAAGGAVCVFRDATQELAERRRLAQESEDLAWLARLRDALDEDRLELYAQPIVHLRSGRPSEELLLRMIGRDGEVVLPGRYLQVAERYGLIVEVDRWVIRRAARLAAAGRRVHVNLSAKTISHESPLLERIKLEFMTAGTDPANVVFELTETALMGDCEAGIAMARGLASLGCGLALDDFGTGFGGLTYLQALPVKCLKIDISFVRDLPNNPTNQHLVKSIVGLAQGLDIETVAEGVEDEDTLALLSHYGVDYAQGYYLGRPKPVIEATAA
jgi:PAS domain S-box-containing protein